MTPVTGTTFPGDFEAILLDEPPPGARPWIGAVRFEQKSGIPIVRGVRIGVIIAVEDVDGDGVAILSDEGSELRGPDRFFGVASSRVLAYVDDEYNEVDYKGLRLRPGFHLLDPCYSSPLVYDASEAVEVELFEPSSVLTLGTRASIQCPVVLFPPARGPMQRALIGSQDCKDVCARLSAGPCPVACSGQTCLELVDDAPCMAARLEHLACLARQIAPVCTSSGGVRLSAGSCEVKANLCTAGDRLTEEAALLESTECQRVCTLRSRATSLQTCATNCPDPFCARLTASQPCLEARRARLACLANENSTWSCGDLSTGVTTPLCEAPAQFDHLCPEVH